MLVDVGFVEKLPDVIPLEAIKSISDELDDCALTRRGNRLSVMPITPGQYTRILSLNKTLQRTPA